MVAVEMSEVNPTLLNGKPMGAGTVISHGDVFDICGRKFLYENVSINNNTLPTLHSMHS